MKRIGILFMTVLLAAIAAVSVGCDAPKLEVSSVQGESYDFSSSAQSSKASADKKSSAQSSQADAKTYTMADIKKLKNTEHFAKNTLEHIFDGTINGKGKATGYHYSMIADSKGKIIDGTRSNTDKNGVFTAKNGFSSFYPESWSPQQVVDAINTAYDDALNDSGNPQGSLWVGYSGDIEIDMYLNSNKQITTAYPVYEGD